MKKVLSVLLAAAMVMGMSVASMAKEADKVWGKGPDAAEGDTTVENLEFGENMFVVFADGHEEKVHMSTPEDEFIFHPGDAAYFPIAYNDGWYTGPIDANWAIYIKDTSSYIKSAEFCAEIGNTYSTKAADVASDNSVKYVKITFQAAYDELDADDVDFYFYIADVKTGTLNKDKLISETVEVHYLFDNWLVEYVDFDFINEVEYKNMKWVTEKGKAGKGTASFCFFKEAYVVAKMNPEEEVIFSYDNSYDKDLDKAYNYDADILSYNFKGTKDEFYREGVLVLPADEDTFVYAWDGEFAEIEAEYVEDYKFDNGKKVDGWMIKTNELGWYVVSDLEAEIEAEEVETEVEAEKANPETGAADFVGAAVAMAVVSVAAAGALALKK